MKQNSHPLSWTTLEEAKQLAALGLSVETADMLYTSLDGHTTPLAWTRKPYIHPQDIPCWSLGALLELIPKIYESENDGGCYPTLCKRYDTDKWHCLYCRDTLYKTRQYDTAIEACTEMIIWLLNNKFNAFCEEMRKEN